MVSRVCLIVIGSLLAFASGAPAHARPDIVIFVGDDDFPAEYRVRDDNTDRVTGVAFTTRIPPPARSTTRRRPMGPHLPVSALEPVTGGEE